MGSDEGRDDERPVHDVDVRPLRVGTTPVTNVEYAWFLAAGRAAEPPWWQDPIFRSPNQPVVGVSWFEASAYCFWLSESLAGHWRLPTEAEWEHAARGGLDIGTVVDEWCHDWYAPDAYRRMRRYDPRGPEAGEARVSRGGSWRGHLRDVEPASRSGRAPHARAADCGFRVVREVP